MNKPARVLGGDVRGGKTAARNREWIAQQNAHERARPHSGCARLLAWLGIVGTVLLTIRVDSARRPLL